MKSQPDPPPRQLLQLLPVPFHSPMLRVTRNRLAPVHAETRQDLSQPVEDLHVQLTVVGIDIDLEWQCFRPGRMKRELSTGSSCWHADGQVVKSTLGYCWQKS